MKYPNVKNVTVLNDYNILVEWETSEKKIFDCKPYINGNWYGQLKDKNFFKTVCPCGNTVEWKDGQDIAPHELYEESIAL